MKIVTLANQEKFMKSITRLSLALIMFSLFSISYLVTSVSAQDKGEAAKDVDIIKNVVQIEEAAATATTGDATEVPSDHPCYSIAPSERDGNDCWFEGEDLSEMGDAIDLTFDHPCYTVAPSERDESGCWFEGEDLSETGEAMKYTGCAEQAGPAAACEEAAETATTGDATEVPSAAPSLLDRVKSFLGIGTTDIAP
jgi:hypothetical protein